MGYNLKKSGEGQSTFDALPADRYQLKIEDAELQTASTGTEMIVTTFVVTSGPYKGRKLWHNFSLTEKSLMFLHRFLKAAGSNLVDEEDVEADNIIKEMIGLKVTAYAEPGKTNSGNPRNTLKNWAAIEDDSDDDDNPSFMFD